MRTTVSLLFSGLLSIFFTALVAMNPTTSFAQEPGAPVATAVSAASGAGTILPVDDFVQNESSLHFFADSTVHLSEVYYGPVFVAGGQVTLDGEVYGDLVVAGGTVRIEGTVHEDIYAAGGTVVITGEVRGNVIAAGGEVLLNNGSLVQQSVLLGAERIELAGSILQDAWVGARLVRLNGSVQGNLQAESESISLSDNAFVGGMLVGSATQPVEKADSSQVVGGEKVQLRQVKPKEDHRTVSLVLHFLTNVVSFSIIMALMTAVLGKQIAWLIKKYSATRISSFGWGALALAVLSIGALFVLMTFFGWKATVLALSAFAGALALGWVVVAAELGQRVIPSQARWVQFVLGGALFGAVASIPFFGSILAFFASVYGVGVALRGLRQE